MRITHRCWLAFLRAAQEVAQGKTSAGIGTPEVSGEPDEQAGVVVNAIVFGTDA